MQKSHFTAEKIRLPSNKPFDHCVAAFVGRLGKFDPTVIQSLANGGDVDAARARIEAMVGPSGLMLFGMTDHGSLLRLVGRPRKSVQIVLGNPLFAIEMTRHDIGASLFAPIRALIFEDDGQTYIDYVRPSSLFAQFGDRRIDEIAASLDRKLDELAAEAAR